MRVVILIISLLFSRLSYAQNNNALDDLLGQFHTQTALWEPIILQSMWGLFWGLAVISLVWNAIQLVLHDKGIVDFIAFLFNRVMTIGLSVWLITNASALAWAIINTFQKVAGLLSTSQEGFSPSNVFELGLSIAHKVYSSASGFSIGDNIVLGICALIILVVFAMIAAEMCILIVGAYVLVSGGVIVMAFLGSEWTRDHAMNYFTTVLGMAVQLFVMQLIIIIGYSMFSGFMTQAGTGSADYLVMVGMCIVYFALVRVVPNMATSLATGRFVFGSGSAVAAATSVAGAAAGAALLGAGAFGAMKGGIGNLAGKVGGGKIMDGVKNALSRFSPTSGTGKMAMKGATGAGKALSGSGKIAASMGKVGLNLLAQQSPVGRAMRDAASMASTPSSQHQDVLNNLNAQQNTPSTSPSSPNTSTLSTDEAAYQAMQSSMNHKE